MDDLTAANTNTIIVDPKYEDGFFWLSVGMAILRNYMAKESILLSLAVNFLGIFYIIFFCFASRTSYSNGRDEIIRMERTFNVDLKYILGSICLSLGASGLLNDTITESTALMLAAYFSCIFGIILFWFASRTSFSNDRDEIRRMERTFNVDLKYIPGSICISLGVSGLLNDTVTESTALMSVAYFSCIFGIILFWFASRTSYNNDQDEIRRMERTFNVDLKYILGSICISLGASGLLSNTVTESTALMLAAYFSCIFGIILVLLYIGV